MPAFSAYLCPTKSLEILGLVLLKTASERAITLLSYKSTHHPTKFHFSHCFTTVLTTLVWELLLSITANGIASFVYLFIYLFIAEAQSGLR